jgi:valyl-tRNA synthetase
MTNISGPLVGMPVIEAREEAIRHLEENNLISSIQNKMQEIPVSERGKNPIEIILLKEWYVRQTHILDRVMELSNDIEFHPPRNRQFLIDWMQNITIDWPISRRRWYHTEIPIWYDSSGTRIIVPTSGKYVRPWDESPPDGSLVIDRTSREVLGTFDEMKEDLGLITGEEKVFDTWMDSSNSNLFVSGYLNEPDVFERAFPTGLRPQGKEIVRTWLYYTLLKSTLLLDKPGFKHVWIDGLGMDPWGRKMSKSLGNGIDADSVLECGAGGRTGSWKVKGPEGKQVHLTAKKIGSECFRLWKACDAQVGDDFHINPEEIESRYFGVLSKLFNVAKFASQFDVPVNLDSTPDNLNIEDRWIMSEFGILLEKVKKSWEQIDIYNATQAIKTFGTGLLASHYLEMVKKRLYDGDESAAWTIHRIVRDLMTVFSPVCPLFTHHITTTIYGTSSVDIRLHPEPIEISFNEDPGITDEIISFNAMVWKAKADAGSSLAAPITGIDIPENISNFSDILTSMHKIE